MRWGRSESHPSRWQVAFAVLPTRIWDGTWVWLEHYEHRLKVSLSGPDYSVNRILGSDVDPFDVSAPTSPPPPKPKS